MFKISTNFVTKNFFEFSKKFSRNFEELSKNFFDLRFSKKCLEILRNFHQFGWIFNEGCLRKFFFKGDETMDLSLYDSTPEFNEKSLGASGGGSGGGLYDDDDDDDIPKGKAFGFGSSKPPKISEISSKEYETYRGPSKVRPKIPDQIKNMKIPDESPKKKKDVTKVSVSQNHGF